MDCPNCSERPLDSVKTSAGELLLCSECAGFFVPSASLALFSTNLQHFMDAVAETQSLRLPTSRICPRCNATLQQGRVRSVGVVLTLCDNCQSLWTNFETLERLDFGVAYSLRTFLETPTMTPGPITQPGSAVPTLASTMETPPIPSSQSMPPLDPSLFPAPPPAQNAEWQSKYSELLQRYEALEKDLRGHWEKRETEMSQRHAADIQKAQESLHQTLQEKLAAAEAEAHKRLDAFKAHVTEVELKRQTLEAEIKGLKNRVESMESERGNLSSQQVRREEEIKRQYADDLKKNQEALQELEKARQKQDKELQDYRSQMDTLARKPPVSEPPKPVEAVKPVKPVEPAAVKPPEPVRAEKKPAGPSIFSNLIDGIRSTWTPLPSQKPVTPGPKPFIVEKPASAPTPTPSPAPKPIEKPAPVPAPAPVSAPIRAEKKPVGPSFFSVLLDGLRSAWTPRASQKPAADAPKPVVVEKPIPSPVPAPVPKLKPVEKPAPVPASAPAAVTAPVSAAPASKLDVQKPAGPPIDWVEKSMEWAPRVAPIFIFLLVKVASYYGDTTTALAWALIVWSVCYGVRLKRMYPSKTFTPYTVADLPGLNQATAWRGVAVTLKGQLTVPPPAKGLSFSDATGDVPLNILSKLEWMPHIFGLSTASQFPSGEITVKGWLRRKANLFVEVADAGNEKTQRHSLVKTLRWMSVWVVLVIAIGTLITADPGY